MKRRGVSSTCLWYINNLQIGSSSRMNCSRGRGWFGVSATSSSLDSIGLCADPPHQVHELFSVTRWRELSREDWSNARAKEDRIRRNPSASPPLGSGLGNRQSAIGNRQSGAHLILFPTLVDRRADILSLDYASASKDHEAVLYQPNQVR